MFHLEISLMKEKNKVATTVKIPCGLYDEFKVLGIRHRISLQELVEKCINLFVKEEPFRNSVVLYSLQPVSTSAPFSSSMIFPTEL